MSLNLIFLVLALFCFALAFIAPFFQINTGRAKLVALGLFFLTAAAIAERTSR